MVSVRGPLALRGVSPGKGHLVLQPGSGTPVAQPGRSGVRRSGADDGQLGASGVGRPEAARKQPHDAAGDVVRVRVTWSEIVTREAALGLDTARVRRLGYDPRDPASVNRYL